ncbi:GtrA family protein [uncultured Sulfitobacter sp.]|uniref:GtrA family protein n=1 Tax=uncultured Sulfitobacter sp. TaxID=191468 RepID=UPI0030D6D265
MMWRQLLRFGIVGLLATFVHMVIGFLLIQSNWQPVFANLLAFTIAFLISFIGHLGFSFADQVVSPSSALWKFALVALIGFACNEMLLIMLLSEGELTDTVSLWISTGCAAVLTFALSRLWAFRAARGAGEPPDAHPSAKLTNQ